MTEWREVNRANWDARVPVHVGPNGYGLETFDDPDHISNVVRYDAPRLGPVDGLDVAHLQCHIGTDTVSLARLGARSVVGLDFSPAAIEVARALAGRAGSHATFVESDVYAAVGALGGAGFDLVYTGIGAICWIPDIAAWAQVVAGLLRPGGRLFMREGHPVLWSMSLPRADGVLAIDYPYFETAGVEFDEPVSYIGEGLVSASRSVQFNHGLGEIFCALRDAGMTVTDLVEHREVPWNPLGDVMSESIRFPGEYELADRPERMPLTYTLQAARTS